MTAINLKGKFNASFEVLPTLPLAGGGTGSGGSGTGGFGTPDTTPPTVTITNPLPGSTISGSVTVTGAVSDNVGIDNVTISIGGGAFHLVTLNGDGTWQYALDTSLYPTGLETISVTATDTSGNTSTVSEAVSFGSSGAVGPYYVEHFDGAFTQPFWTTGINGTAVFIPGIVGGAIELTQASSVGGGDYEGVFSNNRIVGHAGWDPSSPESGTTGWGMREEVWYSFYVRYPSFARIGEARGFLQNLVWHIDDAMSDACIRVKGYLGVYSSCPGVHWDGTTLKWAMQMAGGNLTAISDPFGNPNVAQIVSTTALAENTWYRVTTHWIFDERSSVGRARLWVDAASPASTPVLDQTRATLYLDDAVGDARFGRLSFGTGPGLYVYRSGQIASTSWPVDFDELKWGPTAASIGF